MKVYLVTDDPLHDDERIWLVEAVNEHDAKFRVACYLQEHEHPDLSLAAHAEEVLFVPGQVWTIK